MIGIEGMIQALQEGIERGEYPINCVDEYLKIIHNPSKDASSQIMNARVKTKNPRPIHALSATEKMFLRAIANNGKPINTSVLYERVLCLGYKGQRGSMQSRVSELKSRGFVDAEKRGMYQISRKGKKAIAKAVKA